MKTKNECIGKEYLLFQKRLKEINWLLKEIHSLNIPNKAGGLFWINNGADIIPCTLIEIDWDNYEIIYAPGKPDNNKYTDGSNFNTLSMPDDYETQ